MGYTVITEIGLIYWVQLVMAVLCLYRSYVWYRRYDPLHAIYFAILAIFFGSNNL